MKSVSPAKLPGYYQLGDETRRKLHSFPVSLLDSGAELFWGVTTFCAFVPTEDFSRSIIDRALERQEVSERIAKIKMQTYHRFQGPGGCSCEYHQPL